jgi:malonyl-CoA reductase/3-hydroxypropionate dehydrogenase (NADP+)
MNVAPGRLAGKIALVTGGAGNIGEVITRRYLHEGATVIITGRNVEKLASYRQRLIETEQVAEEQVIALRMDGSQIAAVRAGVAEIIERLGKIDILVNNAGSAGARRRLPDIPLDDQELQSPDTETLPQAIGNLLGISWNLARVVAPHMLPGSSIINVSTIFSRTDYYGRIPYVVPKAALNALGRQLATELGAHGIRVNTIYPGPIESERIRTVFKAMDGLKGVPEGTTAEGFFDIMRLARPDAEGNLTKGFPTPLDIANAAVFLGSDESRAFAGHPFEVTHGMDVPDESRTTFVSRPGLRTIDAAGRVTLIWANTQVSDALHYAATMRACGTSTVVGFTDREALAQAENYLQQHPDTVAVDIYGRPTDAAAPLLIHLDPRDSAAVAASLAWVCGTLGCPQDVILLPGGVLPAQVPPLAAATDAVVARFLHESIGGAVAMSTLLARFWQAHPPTDPPRVLFVSDGDDQHGNRYADLLRAGIEQLIRVWRHESAQIETPQDATVPLRFSLWANQIIRYTNAEPASRDFAAAWIARLIGSAKRIEEINLYLPKRLAGSIGIHTQGFGWAESLFGLHMGKVALITGGSAGIGGQIGRLLAMSGAQVMLCARNRESLETMRDSIIAELREAGYPSPERRIQIWDNCDVGRPDDLAPMVEQTLAVFGRVDYLINNAGIAGAEEMVVDLPVDRWRHTLETNLISNYRLMRRLTPQMRARGGYILNVSSYFGGEKYVAIPYPNRSDYAVSKAGQRALVESLARFYGPNIQINAIAPGPVEGDRLRGTGERPGLFERRARLILENKRLNDIMAALFEVQRTHELAIVDVLPNLLTNDVVALSKSTSPVPHAIRNLAQRILDESDPEAVSRTYLMNERILKRMFRRLEVGCHLAKKPEMVAYEQQNGSPMQANLAISDQRHAWHPSEFGELPAVPEPFFTSAQIVAESTKVRKGIMGMLDLQRMPTEFDVALATVYYLADRNVTGETFHPSGGLKFDRTVTEGELFGKGSPQRLERLRGSTVYLIGEHLRPQLVSLIRTYIEEYDVAQVVLMTETEAAAKWFNTTLSSLPGARRVGILAIGDQIESGIERALLLWGQPSAVISTPFRPLPKAPLAAQDDWSQVLSEDEFVELVEHNITHHFRIAQKVSLIDGANLVFVTPETSARSTAEQFALANFIKTSLHALTATLGAESERVVPHVPINQVDLTRRARSEEPRNQVEEEEELARFVQAVLLVSAPLPSPQESRYRARIYRGNAITV